MNITDLSYFDDLRAQKVAVKGGHSYSTSYSITEPDISSFSSSSKFRKYLKYFDISVDDLDISMDDLTISVEDKDASHYGTFTIAKASVYGSGTNSSVYAVAKASA